MSWPIIEEFKHAGLNVKIGQEEDGSFADPRDMDNLGTMFCWHPSYTLGDEQFTERDGYESMADVERYLREERGAVVTIPLYLLDHSGISMSAGEPSPFDNPTIRTDHHGNGLGWDTSHVGYIYTTRERIVELCGEPQIETDEFYCPRTWPEDGRSGRNWTGTAMEWIVQQLRNEVDVYDQFLRGEVYWYSVSDDEDETLDSCGGFLGGGIDPDGNEIDGFEYVKQEAKEAAESCAKERGEEDPWNVYCDAERRAFEVAAKRLRQYGADKIAAVREQAEESGSDIADVCAMLLGDKEIPEGWNVKPLNEACPS